MRKIHDIPGLDETSLELLEAAGFIGIDAIARAGVEELTNELERANSILRIAPTAPSRAQVKEWIREARQAAGGGNQAMTAEEEEAVDFEQSPEIAAALAHAPCAIPLPARVLMANKVSVGDIPPALLLNRYPGDLDARFGIVPSGGPKPKSVNAPAAVVRVSEGLAMRQELDSSRLRTTSEAATLRIPTVAPVKVSPAADRVALIRAPRTATNNGRNPESRFYIRGVLHSHPHTVTMGALVTLIVMFIIPVAIVSALLLLLSGEVPKHFAWVPGWLIVFPIVLPVFGAAYMIWGLGASCRICGHKLFRATSHFKNKRAHHLPLLGYVFPLCIHILLFRWFRCTHCGTPVRLKE